MSITVKIDESTIQSIRTALAGIKNGYENALVTSINKTLTTAKTQATARIGNELNLSASRIKEDFTVKKASYSDPSGYLRATGEPVGLINFGANQTNQGVSVKVKRSGSRSLLKHAFISTGNKSSTQHVFWRAGQTQQPDPVKFFSGVKSKAAWPKFGKEYRFSLERLTGPRIEDIFAQAHVFDPVTIQANTLFLSNVAAKFDELLRRHNG